MEDSTGRKGQGEHESPSDAVNAQEPVGLPQQGKPNSNVNLESWLSRDPVDARYQLWMVPVIGVAYLLHLRIRRSHPRTLPTLTSLKLGEIYGSAAVLYSAEPVLVMAHDKVEQDEDLRTLETVARYERQRFAGVVDFCALFKSKAFDGHKVAGPVEGHPKDEKWVPDHISASEPLFSFYYRALYEQYADKYPDISPQDWKTCITHIASTTSSSTNHFMDLCVWAESGLIGTIPFAMIARRWPFPLITPFLNGLQRSLAYLFTYFAVMQPYCHWAYPLTLQNKQRVAEMLREAYQLDKATPSYPSPKLPPNWKVPHPPAAKE